MVTFALTSSITTPVEKLSQLPVLSMLFSGLTWSDFAGIFFRKIGRQFKAKQNAA